MFFKKIIKMKIGEYMNSNFNFQIITNNDFQYLNDQISLTQLIKVYEYYKFLLTCLIFMNKKSLKIKI